MSSNTQQNIEEWAKIEKAYNCKKMAVLKLYVNSTNIELIELYKKHVSKHNASLLDEETPNSGFDIFVPSQVKINENMGGTRVKTLVLNPNKKSAFDSKMIDMEIKAEMVEGSHYKKETEESSPYFIYPRSSISKTPLMLANHTGIIDAGYRGFLIGAFRSLDSKNPYTIEKHTRLLQICHPSLCPIYVVFVNEDEFSKTTRGAGGFGSTGV